MVRDSERIFDEFLIASSATGDRAAMSRLIARWQPRLFRHARRMTGDPDLAKDVVQDAWMDILRGLARLNDAAAFPAWAYRIVTRRCQYEARRRGHRVFENADEVLDGLPHGHASGGELQVDIQAAVAAIETLPRAQQAALALFYIEGLSVAEIAIATDVAPGTVKTRLMHARNKVRAQLEGASHA